METLFAIAIVALIAISISMVIVALRRVREDRERRAARAEALRADAFAGDALIESPLRLVDSRPVEPPRLVDSRPVEPALLRTEEPPSPVADIFATAPASDAAGRRWLALMTVAGVMSAVIGIVYVLHGGGDGVLPDRSSVATQASVTPAVLPQTPPIALTSLQHTDAGPALNVAGTVRNPASAPSLQGVNAVIEAFDRNGGQVAVRSAPLEAATLAPGAESRFFVAMTDGASIARYQVTFRASDGSLIRHLDRRERRTAQAQD